jgi:hypothetical protein
MSKDTPHFRDLSDAECRLLLERHHVGRLAYSFHDRVDIEPIGFVYEPGGIVFRTAPGSKFLTLKHHPWVALEIDEVKGMFEWQSVVVHGTTYVLSDLGTPAEVAAYHAALDTLRRFVPETLGPGDPTPFRSVVMRLHLDGVSGRAAEPGVERIPD